MATGAEEAVAEVWADWQDAVNMTANELEDFLGTDESRSVGDKVSGGESTSHQSGRRIVGSRVAVLRRSEGTRFRPRVRRVGDCQSAIREERA
jgi:hypothetical protein